jgi:hypothetical protein
LLITSRTSRPGGHKAGVGHHDVERELVVDVPDVFEVGLGIDHEDVLEVEADERWPAEPGPPRVELGQRLGVDLERALEGEVRDAEFLEPACVRCAGVPADVVARVAEVDRNPG